MTKTRGFQPKQGAFTQSKEGSKRKPTMEVSPKKKGGFNQSKRNLNTNGGVSKNNKRGFHKTREFPPKQGGFNQNRGVSPEIKGVQTKQEFQSKKGRFQPKQESFTKSKKASPKTGEFQSKEGRFNQNYRVSTKRREGLLKIRVYHQKIRVFHQK